MFIHHGAEHYRLHCHFCFCLSMGNNSKTPTPPHNHTFHTSNTDQIYFRLRISFLTSEFRQCIPARIVSSAMESPVSCNHDLLPKSHNSLTCQGSIILQQPKLKKKPKPSTYIRTFSAWSCARSFPITSLATLTFETSYPRCLVLQKRLVIR